MNHERFGESMDLGLIADIYDVISGHSTDKFLVWCHRLMKPLENGCVWALVKGEEIHKVKIISSLFFSTFMMGIVLDNKFTKCLQFSEFGDLRPSIGHIYVSL